MQIYLAADHRGLDLKETIKIFLRERGYREVRDVGAVSLDPQDDYADFARAALEEIVKHPGACGILMCGSGHGADMVANKFRGIRSALCFNAAVARQSREHENANVLSLAADWLDEVQAREIVRAWLETPFSEEERHVRRLRKMEEIEEENFK